MMRILALVLLAASCNAPSPPNGAPPTPAAPDTQSPRLPFAVYDLIDPSAPQVQALGGGVITLRDGCLYFGSHPVSLPKQYTQWDASAGVLTFVGREFRLGETISTNGGYRARAGLPTEGEESLPSSCEGDEIFGAGTQIAR